MNRQLRNLLLFATWWSVATLFVMAVTTANAADSGFLAVKVPTAKVMSGANVLAEVKSGQRLLFTQQQGDWFLVDIRQDNQMRQGWIHRDDVVVENPESSAPPLSTPAKTFAEGPVLLGHRGSAFQVVVMSDGRRVLTTGVDGTLRTWDLATGKELSAIQAHSKWAVGLAVSPDGQRAVTSGNDKTVRLWNLATGQELRRFEGHGNAVWRVRLSSDGKRLLTASHDRTARLWDVESGVELRRFECGGPCVDVCFAPDGKRILTCETSAQVWRDVLPPPAPSSEAGGAVRLWDVETGQQVRMLTGLAQAVTVVISPDGTKVLAGGTAKAGSEGENLLWREPGLLLLWDIETGKALARMEGHTATVRVVACSPDGRMAVTTGYDRTVRLWDLQTGTQLARYDWPGPVEKRLPLFGVTFTPNGRHVIVAGAGGVVRVLEIRPAHAGP